MEKFIESTAKKRRVLAVDDEMINRELLGMILSADYDVDFAENGVCAMNKLSDNSYSLILLDLLMPEMNGFEVIERCTADEKLKAIPIIVMTSEKSAEVKSIKLGAADFITKPFVPEELLARVGKSLYAPPHVLLIGPVNAGKSSLLNALLGFGRVLVDPRAGTTRDAVSVETVIDGFPLRLSDTAGVREGAGRLEKEGIGRIAPLLDKADLLLTVYDITAPGTDPVAEFTRALCAAGGVFPRGETPSLLVLNKCDIPRKERNRFWQAAPRGRNTIETSVFQPGTIVDLQKRLIGILFPAIPETGEFVPLNARQLSYTRARCR